MQNWCAVIQKEQNVALTVLRKGQEQKITVKLTKKEVPPQRHEFGPGRHRHSDFAFGDKDFGAPGEQFNDLKDQLGDAKRGLHMTEEKQKTGLDLTRGDSLNRCRLQLP